MSKLSGGNYVVQTSSYTVNKSQGWKIQHRK